MKSKVLSKMEELVGVDVKYEGKKAWFYCSRCSYKNDRQYHAKMHFLRIHVNGGNSCESKRKYKTIVPSVADFFRQTLHKKTPAAVKKKIIHNTGIKTEMVFGDFDIVTTITDGVGDAEVNLFDFM